MMVIPKFPLRDSVLHKYLEKYKAFSSVEGKLTLQATKEKLGGYCNMSLYYTQHSRPAMQRVLNDPLQHAPKFQAAADLVIDAEGKCAVFCHRRRGLYAFVRLLQHRGKGIRIATIPEDPKQAAMNLASIKEFNSPENLRGEQIKVIVVDTRAAGEGVSLPAVRHVVLLDVPERWADYEQWVGRTSRMCGHHALPKDEQTIDVYVLCAELPEKDDQSSLQFLHAVGLPRDVIARVTDALQPYADRNGLKDDPDVYKALYALCLPSTQLQDIVRGLRKLGDGPKDSQDEASWRNLEQEREIFPRHLEQLAAIAVDSAVLRTNPEDESVCSLAASDCGSRRVSGASRASE
jgi:hypothetical protein